jgi:hypothetical protein
VDRSRSISVAQLSLPTRPALYCARAGMATDGPPSMQTAFTKTLGIKCESLSISGVAAAGPPLPCLSLARLS